MNNLKDYSYAITNLEGLVSTQQSRYNRAILIHRTANELKNKYLVEYNHKNNCEATPRRWRVFYTHKHDNMYIAAKIESNTNT
jgi:hypothetical protein